MPTRTLKLNIDARPAKQGADQFAGSIRQITTAVKAMETSTVSAFSKLSTASQGGLQKFSTQLNALNKVSVSGGLTKDLNALGMAMKEFKAPSKAQIRNLAAFSEILPTIKLPRSNFDKLTRMTEAMINFRAPTKAQTQNFIEFTQALHRVKLPPNMEHITTQLERIARASMRASAGLRGVQRRLRDAGLSARRAGDRFSRATGHMRGLENSFDGTYQAASLLRRAFGVFTLARFTQSVFEATTAYERFLNLNKAIAQSINEPFRGAQQYDELKKVTNELGGDLRVALDEFGKFSAAARTSGLSAEKTMDTYKALTGASTVLGLSQERTRLSFLAVTQILSKGRVSTEELRRQLGEQIPGLFEDFSKEIKSLAVEAGVQIDSLDDALRRGLVSGKGGILVLEKILSEKYGRGVQDALKRADIQLKLLKNTFFDLQVQIGKSDFMQTLADAFENVNMQIQRPEFRDLAEKLGSTLASAAFKASEALGWMLDNMDKVIFAAKAFTAIITVGALKRFGLAVASMASPMTNLIMFFGAASRKLLGLKVAADASAGAVTRLGFALRTALIGTGIGAVAVAIGSVAAASVNGAKRTQDFKDGLLELGKDPITIGQKLHFVFSSIGGVFSNLASNLTKASDEMSGFAKIAKTVLEVMLRLRTVMQAIGLGVAGKIEEKVIASRQTTLQQSRKGLSAAIREREKKFRGRTSEGGIKITDSEKAQLRALDSQLSHVEDMIAEKVSEGFLTGFTGGNIIDGASHLVTTINTKLSKGVEDSITKGIIDAASFAPGAKLTTEFWEETRLAIAGAEKGFVNFQKSQEDATKKREKIDPTVVFGVSLKAVQALNKEYASLLKTLVPTESATSNYLVQQKKLNDMQLASRNLLEQKEQALARYSADVKKTVQDETERTRQIEMMNDEITLAEENTKLYSSALKKLSRDYVSVAVEGGGALVSIVEGLEQIGRMRGTVDEAILISPDAESALQRLKMDLGDIADNLLRITNLRASGNILEGIFPGLGAGANQAADLAQFEMMGDFLNNPLDAKFSAILSKIPADQMTGTFKAIGEAYEELGLKIKKTKFEGADSLFDNLGELSGLGSLSDSIDATSDSIAALYNKMNEGPLSKEDSAMLDSLQAVQANQELTARDSRLDLGIGTAADGFSAALDEMLLSAQSWQQQVGDILAQPLNQLADGVGNAASQILVFGADAGETFKQLGRTILAQLVGSLAKLGVQMVINAVLGKTLTATATAASATAAAAVAAAWATPAALVNASTFGAGAAAGTAAITGSVAAIQALASVSSGGIQPFAKGGVVSDATLFSHSGGMGVMGEAGSEAIMPLQRGSDGKLGVRMHGGNGGNTIINKYEVSIDARGAEQGVEEKIQEALVVALPPFVNLATQAAKNSMSNTLTRDRL